MKKQNKSLVPIARNLRHAMTKEERHLWYDFLSTYKVRFMRQKVIGKYIADFYCSKAKLIIEIDGSQHFSEEGLEYDKVRTEFIEEFGLQVLRFSNIDINQRFNSVCEYIDMQVKERIRED